MIKDIIRIKYADSFISESCVFAGGAQDRKMPIIFSVFLVVTDKRKILVDAGCETMQGFDMRNFTTPMAVLEGMGYNTADITDIIITHAHHDHIECVKYFKNAVIHIQKEELALGRKYIPDGFKVDCFDDGFFIEDNIETVKIAGHSAGSCVVECKKDGKIFVLCGDECYSFYNLENKVPTATSFSEKRSTEFISKYSAAEYTCLLCHDL